MAVDALLVVVDEALVVALDVAAAEVVAFELVDEATWEVVDDAAFVDDAARDVVAVGEGAEPDASP